MTISFSLLLNRRINLEKKQEKSPFRNYNIPVFRDLPILVFFFSNWWKSYTLRWKYAHRISILDIEKKKLGREITCIKLSISRNSVLIN